MIFKVFNEYKYLRKNILRPFDDSKPLEYLSEKNDSSLIVFGSSSKKRPYSLIMGRTFDKEMIDMFEFGIENVKFMEDFKVIIKHLL
jgi:ribosome production factor 2